ncbi:MAG: preprotein translocase subunit SecG [Phoenicibacter congonensis]|uniref:Preprotein translocase subunit SecG n=1 Tax=Phoenicibacter congonensis TaxID=1944646 RepID=A0AA43RIM8_9ACTN|nr:preprotein translocase subunit SecG [Phoenicibacter congonensis]
MSPFAIILLVLLFISGTGLVVFILMHSGKGTGISDAIARITIICAIVFIVTLILMMIFFPTGYIASSN